MSDYLASILNDLPSMSDNEDEEFLRFVDYINAEDFSHDTSRNEVMKQRIMEDISDDNEVIVIDDTSDDNEVIVIESTSDKSDLISLEDNHQLTTKEAPKRREIEERSDDNEVIVLDETCDENEVIVIEETSDENEVIIIEATSDESEEDIDEPQIVEKNPIDSHYVPMTEEDKEMIRRLNANICPEIIRDHFERQLEIYHNTIMDLEEQRRSIGVTTRSQRKATHHLSSSGNVVLKKSQSTMSTTKKHQQKVRSVYRNM